MLAISSWLSWGLYQSIVILFPMASPYSSGFSQYGNWFPRVTISRASILWVKAVTRPDWIQVEGKYILPLDVKSSKHMPRKDAYWGPSQELSHHSAQTTSGVPADNHFLESSAFSCRIHSGIRFSPNSKSPDPWLHFSGSPGILHQVLKSSHGLFTHI